MSTKKEISDIEDLINNDATALVKAEAGAGKSSVTAKTIHDWALGKTLKKITCCLILSAGSTEKIPMNKLIWDEYKGIHNLDPNEIEELFKCLLVLAFEGALAIIIDGLDELGTMSKTDVSNAARAAAHPSLAVDMRTLCAGILSKTILPGAKVLATGRSTEVINRDVLEGRALLYEFVDLTDKDRTKLIAMMEQDKGEKERIQKEIDRVATDNNEFFMKTPLMVRMIITLIIDKKVTIENAKNSSEIYLMLLLNRAVKTLYIKPFITVENLFLLQLCEQTFRIVGFNYFSVILCVPLHADSFCSPVPEKFRLPNR